jgi:hypothetical protein
MLAALAEKENLRKNDENQWKCMGIYEKPWESMQIHLVVAPDPGDGYAGSRNWYRYELEGTGLKQIQLFFKQVQLFFKQIQHIMKQIQLFFKQIDIFCKQRLLFLKQIQHILQQIQIFVKQVQLFFKQIQLFLKQKCTKSAPKVFRKCTKSVARVY